MRAEQRLNPETGICLSAQQDELILACDEGRVMRPLLVISGDINQQDKVCTGLRINLTPLHVMNNCGPLNQKTL